MSKYVHELEMEGGPISTKSIEYDSHSLGHSKTSLSIEKNGSKYDNYTLYTTTE